MSDGFEAGMAAVCIYLGLLVIPALAALVFTHYADRRRVRQ